MKNQITPSNQFARASKLTNPTYLSALAYWALRKLTRIQFHHVYAVDLSQPQEAAGLENGFAVSVVKHLEDLENLPPGMEAQLNEQSGMSCRALCERGARLYFIHSGHDIACQLNINSGEVTVDSPADLHFRLNATDAFLNYLYTRDAFRGHGLARKLIRYACSDLSKQDKQRCFAHIRATNHASLNAFKLCGWRFCGRIITTTSRHFLAAPGCAQSGILVSPVVSRA